MDNTKTIPSPPPDMDPIPKGKAKLTVAARGRMTADSRKPIDLAAIRAREAKATKGPWVEGSKNGVYAPNVEKDYPEGALVMDLTDGGGPYGEDLDFVLHARADIPALLALVDELAAALALSASGGTADTPEDCRVDALLKQCGYPDQASRELDESAGAL